MGRSLGGAPWQAIVPKKRASGSLWPCLKVDRRWRGGRWLTQTADQPLRGYTVFSDPSFWGWTDPAATRFLPANISCFPAAVICVWDWPTTSWSALVNKVLLELSQASLFMCCLWLLPGDKAGLRSCTETLGPIKPKAFTSSPLTESLLILVQLCCSIT